MSAERDDLTNRLLGELEAESRHLRSLGTTTEASQRKRVELFRRLIELGVPKVKIAKVAGVSDTAVIRALERADAGGESKASA